MWRWFSSTKDGLPTYSLIVREPCRGLPEDLDALEKSDWSPFGLNVVVRDGIVHLNGVITEERSRQAAIVAAENVEGVKKVHDHLCWVDTMSGIYLNSPEDEGLAKAS